MASQICDAILLVFYYMETCHCKKNGPFFDYSKFLLYICQIKNGGDA